jgi:hypothetical protein
VYPVGTSPQAIALADVDGDGHLDLITANRDSNDISVLLGRGDGTFHSQMRFATGIYPDALATADLNGDGHLDLVTANYGETNTNDVSVLLGRGDGTFLNQVSYPVGDSPVAVAITDVNGDGRPDLIAANYTSSDVSVLLGQGSGHGDGTFGAST